MKTLAELREQQLAHLDESWRNVAATVLVLRIRNFSKKITAIRFSERKTTDENISSLFKKIDLLAEQNNSVGYLTGQLGVMKDGK
jgi:hypothetical protein